jgi:5-methylcytosine-specific restriction endonuclease McrA
LPSKTSQKVENQETSKDFWAKVRARFSSGANKTKKTPKTKLEVLIHKEARRNLPMGFRGQKSSLYIRQRGMCAYCPFIFTNGSQATRDHVLPKSKGGKNTLDNLVLACRKCNKIKGQMFTEVEFNAEIERLKNMARIVNEKQRPN